MVLGLIVSAVRLTIFLYIASVYWSVILAKDRNISRLYGLALGILLGPIGVIILFFLPERLSPGRRAALERKSPATPLRHEGREPTEFWIAKNGQQLGTLSTEEISRRLDQGELSMKDTWWNTEMGQWYVLSTLPAIALNDYHRDE